MKNDFKYIDLFEEMLLSEKMSSQNTVRAYRKDIELFINYVHKELQTSILEKILIYPEIVILEKYLL